MESSELGAHLFSMSFFDTVGPEPEAKVFKFFLSLFFGRRKKEGFSTSFIPSERTFLSIREAFQSQTAATGHVIHQWQLHPTFENSYIRLVCFVFFFFYLSRSFVRVATGIKEFQSIQSISLPRENCKSFCSMG